MDTPLNIEWNPANFVTVLLIVGIGYTVIGFLARAWQQKNGATS